MRYLGWRLLSVVGVFVLALILPLIVLVVVTGLVRTGAVGVLAFVVWLTAMVVVVKAALRRRRLRA